MSHDRLAPAPKQEVDPWDAPMPEASNSDWDTNLWDTPETAVESPKRRGLAKRLGEKVANITRKTDNELVDHSATEQASTEEDRKDAHDALMAAKEELRIAEEDLAEREKYFDSQGAARLPKSDNSGFTDSIPKTQLTPSQTEQAKYFDAQQQHLAVGRAKKALEAAQANADESNRNGWDTSESAAQPTHSENNNW